ncbi:hypothetical protein HDV62DRAFT_138906 [Trichoderma sp. SZMC 28011]
MNKLPYYLNTALRHALSLAVHSMRLTKSQCLVLIHPVIQNVNILMYLMFGYGDEKTPGQSLAWLQLTVIYYIYSTVGVGLKCSVHLNILL